MEERRLKLTIFGLMSLIFALFPLPFLSGWEEEANIIENIVSTRLCLSVLGWEVSIPYRILLAISVLLFYGAISDYIKPKS